MLLFFPSVVDRESRSTTYMTFEESVLLLVGNILIMNTDREFFKVVLNRVCMIRHLFLFRTETMQRAI